jgi:hypothetical protein
MQRYFQQIRPLSACDAEDGRIVGRMLKDLVESKPKHLAHAIRTFANNTAMLRVSGFRHIGVMLEHLLTADASGGAVNDAAIAALDPSLLTEKQAIAIGSAIASSVHQAQTLAAGLKKVIKSYAVLQAMKSEHAWFVPMLEVLTVHKAKQARRSTLGKRLRSIVAAEAPSSSVEADEADEESSFSSVVWPNAHTLAASAALFPLFGLRAQQCHTRHRRTVCRCLWMPVRARSSTHRSTSSLAATLQATRRYVHELGIVTTICDAMPFFLLRFAILRELVQVPATASSITRHLPPELSSPRQLASVAWPDVTSSPRSDSSLLEALQPEMKRA